LLVELRREIAQKGTQYLTHTRNLCHGKAIQEHGPVHLPLHMETLAVAPLHKTEHRLWGFLGLFLVLLLLGIHHLPACLLIVNCETHAVARASLSSGCSTGIGQTDTSTVVHTATVPRYGTYTE
jgi:hypothetical protein